MVTWTAFAILAMFAKVSATKIAHFGGGPETSHHCICTKYQLQTVWSGQQITEKYFKHTWITLMADFGLNVQFRVHIIVDHLSNYFEPEGSTLRHTTVLTSN